MIVFIFLAIAIVVAVVVIKSLPKEVPETLPPPTGSSSPPSPPPPSPPPSSSSSSSSSSLSSPSSSPSSSSVAPSITYTGPLSQPFPPINRHPTQLWMNSNVPEYEIYYYGNYSLPFRLTFPVGTTRVRVTHSGIGNFSEVNFVPGVNETSRDIYINYTSTGFYQQGYFWFRLLLNNDTTPSASIRWFMNSAQV